MTWVVDAYASVLLAAGIIGLGLAVFGWTRRRAPGGAVLAGLMLIAAWWCFCGAIEASVIAPAAKVLAAKFQYISIASLPLLWLLFALSRGRRLTAVPVWLQASLWFIPVTLVGLAFTNELHGLIWRSIHPISDRPGAMLLYGHGSAFWVYVVYSYVLVLIATVLLVRDALRVPGVFRMQTAWLLAGAAFPWLGNIAYMFHVGPPGVDLTPVAFTLAGGCLAVSLLRYRLLDVVPVAHDQLLSRMADSVLVLSPDNRILDLNPAARRLLGVSPDAVGSPLVDLLAPWPDFAAMASGLLGRGKAEVVHCPVMGRWLDVGISELHDALGRFSGRLIILHDITPLKAAEEERVSALERIGRQQQAVVALAVHPAVTAGDLPAAAAALTEAAGVTMGIERTSLWLGSYEEGRIRCLDLFERSAARHSSGSVLSANRYPAYFAAVADGRVIDAADAASDPRTAEFLEDYLRPLGIGSMLDAPIRAGGRVRGIVCFEPLGPARPWRPDEIRFAGEVADQAAQALLNAERRAGEEALRQREERLRFVTDNQLDMLGQFDGSGIAVYVSPSVKRILGFDYRDLLGRRAEDFIHPDDYPGLAREIEAARRERCGTLRCEYRFRHADGSYPWMESEILIYDDDQGGPGGLIVSSRDVTQRRRAEEALRASVREKDVLLKEVHHRVRNNMQVISSLLNLQAQAVPDPLLRRLVEESRGRIKAMALVHERLYRSPDLARIDFADYAKSLAVHVFQVMQADSRRISFEPRLESLDLDIGLSIPLGLVLNELVSNALKHAFPESRSGSVTVGLERTGQGWARLTVRDDGVGWTGPAGPEKAESLGLQIIRTLVAQIDGTLTFRRDGGTVAEADFPLPA